MPGTLAHTFRVPRRAKARRPVLFPVARDLRDSRRPDGNLYVLARQTDGARLVVFETPVPETDTLILAVPGFNE
jgi:hypothetical protein